jgi:hypothetical protein
MSYIFICYSRVDNRLAEDLTNLLRRAYDRVWFDDNLHGGEEWWAEIVKEIAACEHFIFLMSGDSLESDWCQKELAEAQQRYKHIIPVLVRGRTEVPDDLARIQRIDMSSGLTVESLNQLYATLIRYDAYTRVSSVDQKQRHLDQKLLERLWPFINGRYIEILTGETQGGRIDWERYTSHITKYLELRNMPRNRFSNPALEEAFEAFDDALVNLDGQIGWTYELQSNNGRPYMAEPANAGNDTYWFEKHSRLVKKATKAWMQHVELVKAIHTVISDFEFEAVDG